MAKVQTPPTPAEARAHLFEVLREFDTAMIAIRGADGSFHARPMAIARLDEAGTFYFPTDINSPKIDEIVRDSDALVTVQGKSRYASVSGTVRLNRDRSLIHELWSESWKAWFENKDDPSIVLLEVTPKTAEYWDNSGFRGVAYMFEAVKAILGGEKAKDAGDSNAKVRLH
jgi:general stress protein 26